MAIGYGPTIVTSGLVLALDAADRNSYPGSGTAWTDLSGRGNTGTLRNGVGYTSGNRGALSFDGVDDYVTLGTPSSLNGVQVPLTICGWGRLNSTSANRTLYSAYKSTSDGQIYSMIRSDSGILKYYASTSTGGYQERGSFSLSSNTWYFYAAVVSGTIASPSVKIFLNLNSQSFSLSSLTSSPDLTVDFRVGNNQFFPNSEGWNGNIAAIQVYTRDLSDTEILQNFNALRGRFSI